MNFVLFIAGLFVGTFFGLFIFALAESSQDEEERMKRRRENGKRKKM